MKTTRILLVLILGLTTSVAALAGGGYHGGGGGYRGGGGGYRGGYHGNNHYHGNRWVVGVNFGYPGWGYGWPYYGYYPYAGYPYPYYPAYYPGPVVQQQPVYVEQQPAPVQEPQQSAIGYWYYCANPGAYYPYVKECPAGWQRVAPQPSN